MRSLKRREETTFINSYKCQFFSFFVQTKQYSNCKAIKNNLIRNRIFPFFFSKIIKQKFVLLLIAVLLLSLIVICHPHIKFITESISIISSCPYDIKIIINILQFFYSNFSDHLFSEIKKKMLEKDEKKKKTEGKLVAIYYDAKTSYMVCHFDHLSGHLNPIK